MAKQSKRPENQTPAPASDERNIVEIDSDYEGATFEDRVYLIWNRHGKQIIAAVVAVILVFCFWLFIGWFQEAREARIGESFRQAGTVEERIAFARAHPNHILAGVAFWEAATHYFEEGDFSQAAEFFRLAAEGLGDAPNVGRARIGQAVSMAKDGKTDESLALLEQIGRNASRFLSDRAEAHYHAAVLAFDLERMDEARDHLRQVMDLDQTGGWSGRARQLERRLPPGEEEPLLEMTF